MLFLLLLLLLRVRLNNTSYFFFLNLSITPPPPSFSSLSCILEQKMAVISGLEVVDVGSCMWRIQAKEREIERERRRWFENLVFFCRFFLVTFSLCCCSPFKHCPWWRDEENVRYWQRCPGQCPNRLRLIERSIDRPNRYRDFRNQSRRLHLNK